MIFYYLNLQGVGKVCIFHKDCILEENFCITSQLVTKKFKHLKAKFSLLLALLLGARYILSFR